LLLVVVVLALLAPALVDVRTRGYTDLGVGSVCVLGALVWMRQLSWVDKIPVILVASLILAFPPIPNYLEISDKGVNFTPVGFLNVLAHPYLAITFLVFNAACLLVAAAVSHKQPDR
jgi:hypothetical protein